MSSESGSEDDWEDVEPLRADDGNSLGLGFTKIMAYLVWRCLICGQKRHTVITDTFVRGFCPVLRSLLYSKCDSLK